MVTAQRRVLSPGGRRLADLTLPRGHAGDKGASPLAPAHAGPGPAGTSPEGSGAGAGRVRDSCNAGFMPQTNMKENLAVAIEILTAMYSDPRSVDFALDRIEAIEDERGKQGIMEAFSGLLQLAVYGAAELGRLTGRTELEVLQRFALNIQSDGLPRLDGDGQRDEE